MIFKKFFYGFMTIITQLGPNLAMQKYDPVGNIVYIYCSGNQIRNMNMILIMRFGCNNCNDPSIPAQSRYLQNYKCHMPKKKS